MASRFVVKVDHHIPTEDAVEEFGEEKRGHEIQTLKVDVLPHGILHPDKILPGAVPPQEIFSL